MGIFEAEFLGGLMTFDVVTMYGLLCGAIFLTGFLVAIRYEKRKGPGAARTSGVFRQAVRTQGK